MTGSSSAAERPEQHGDVTDASWSRRVRTMDPDALRELAVSLPTLEQAKGIVMGYYGCDPRTAFVILQRWSSIHRLELRTLAEALVAEASTGTDAAGELPTGAVDRFLRRHHLP